jgi:predicted DCC family thiol-disulfide oxidoreductase YuxK
LNALKTVFGIDLRTLALFRVMVALMILADLVSRARDLTAHYTDAGILPRAEHLRLPGGWRWSFHLVGGSATVEAVLFAIAALIALALLVGYRTRLATVLSWLFLASLQARNPTLIQGGDNLLLLLLFWGMFLPLGARFAIDAALDRRAGPAPNAYCSVATAALLVQCMSVYFFSALLKSGPEWWPDGTAVYFALHLDHLATPFAVWFRQFSPVLAGLTYYVWVLELIGPILMFVAIGFPWVRLGLQAMFITMHIGFILCLDIGLFPFISITSLLAFTPGVAWDWLERRARTPARAGLRIYYDADCEFCRKVCLVLRTMLLLPAIPIREAQGDAGIHAEMQTHNSWVVVDHDGARHVRWQAVALVFRRSPLFAPLGALMAVPSLARLGDRVYEAVARNRPGLGRLTAAWLPYREESLHLSSAANLAVGALALVVLWINLASLPALTGSLPRFLRDVQSTLVLAQKWNMFAPAPGVSDGWYVVRGVTREGTVVDVLKETKGEPDFFRPGLLSREYANYRWRKYLHRLAYSLDETHQSLYAQYLCRMWDRRKPSEGRLARVELYFNYERVELGYQPRTTQRILLHAHVCAPDTKPAPEKILDAI